MSDPSPGLVELAGTGFPMAAVAKPSRDVEPGILEALEFAGNRVEELQAQVDALTKQLQPLLRQTDSPPATEKAYVGPVGDSSSVVAQQAGALANRVGHVADQVRRLSGLLDLS